MITGIDIYWITRLNEVRGLFVAAGVVSTLILGLFVLIRAMIMDCSYGEERDELKMIFVVKLKKYSRLLIVPFLFFASVCFIPTTKEMCAILIIPKIINNEQIQELPEKAVELANEWIDELRPKKTEK